MIAMADDHLDKYVRGVHGPQDSVRWTQPVNTCMPYHGTRRWPRLHRADWQQVDGDLERILQRDFAKYEPGAAAIWQAHIISAGRPEQELDRVECGLGGLEGPPEPKVINFRTTSAPREEHGAEFLSNYKSSADEWAEESDAGAPPPGLARLGVITAQRAAVMPRSPPPARISSPPTPAEVHRRRRMDMVVYERNCRQRLRAEAESRVQQYESDKWRVEEMEE
jgi:hypothetical protein